MSNFKITKKKKIHDALFVMECPFCGEICASASEFEYLPEFTTCSNCPDVFQIYKVDEKQFIERLIFPRFKAVITFNSQLSDVENIQMIDECDDVSLLAKSMREAGDYIINFKSLSNKQG